MLFSNDHALQQDFKNLKLVGQPPGTVYSTLRCKAFDSRRKAQLRQHRCMSASKRRS